MASKNELNKLLNTFAPEPGEGVETPQETQHLAEEFKARKSRAGRPQRSLYNRGEWGPITFFGHKPTMEKIRAIATIEGLLIQEVIQEALTASIEKYEKEKGHPVNMAAAAELYESKRAALFENKPKNKR